MQMSWGGEGITCPGKRKVAVARACWAPTEAKLHGKGLSCCFWGQGWGLSGRRKLNWVLWLERHAWLEKYMNTICTFLLVWGNSHYLIAPIDPIFIFIEKCSSFAHHEFLNLF